VEVPIEGIEEEGDVEVIVHQQDNDSDASVENEFNGCIKTVRETNLTPSLDQTQLGVVRCTLAQPEQPNDWRRAAIFHTCTKIKNKSYKVKVDIGSCINAVVEVNHHLGNETDEASKPLKDYMDRHFVHKYSGEMSNSHPICHIDI